MHGNKKLHVPELTPAQTVTFLAKVLAVCTSSYSQSVNKARFRNWVCLSFTSLYKHPTTAVKLKNVEGRGMGRADYGFWESVVSSPSGVLGGATAAKKI